MSKTQHKNRFTEWTKLPRQPKQDVQEAIKITSSEDLKFSLLFPLEQDLLNYLDCSQMPDPCPVCDASGNVFRGRV